MSNQEQQAAMNPKVLGRLLSYMKPHKFLVILGLTGLVFATVAELIIPVILQQSMDLYILPGQGLLSQAERMDGLIYWGRIFLAVLILSLGANFVQVYFSALAGQRIMKDLRGQLFSHLLKQSLSFLGDTPVGKLVSRVTSDVETVNELFTTVALAIMKDVALMVGALITLFLLHVPLTFIVLGTLPPVILLTLIARRRIRQVYRETQHQTSKINSFLSESIMGMAVVQLFGRQKDFHGDFDSSNQAYYRASMKEMYTYSAFRPLVNLLSSVSIGLLIYFGTSMHNNQTISLGILIAFVHLIEKFYSPLRDITDKITILQSAMAGGERVFKMLDEDHSIEDQGQASIEEFRGELEFQDVWFSYRKDPVLKGLSFKLKPGETMAVVGSTGAGKSTLANLVARFWDINQGSVLLDGRDIRDIPLTELRSQVQTVQQDVTLFSGTIRENITLGRDFSEEQIQEALEKVKARPFIDELPDGLDTQLSEGAANLSFGQRQLISFARIFLFNPPLIILDEATSNIDTETESWIQQAMEELLKQRSSIIIAHRLSTIARADRIMVLSRGELAEMGSHQELMERGGIYYNLYQLQYKD